MKNYYKFTAVRHPYTRAVSGYKDKLVDQSGLWQGLARKIAAETRPMYNASKEEKIMVTFEEFLKYIAKYGIENRHFENIESICHPCQVKYDYISKLETFASDFQYIVNERLEGIGSVDIHKKRKGGLVAPQILVTQFERITSKVLNKVYKKFQFGMNVFGYSVSLLNNTVQANCGDPQKTDTCC